MKNEVRPAPFCQSKTNPQPHKVKPPEIAAGDQSPYLQTRRRRPKSSRGMKNEVRPAPFCPSKTNPQPHKVKPPEIAAGDQSPSVFSQNGKIAAGDQSPSVSPHPGKPAAPEPSPHHEQNQDTFFRNCFISPRRRFDSTKRRLVALERFALRRRSLETSASCD